MRSFTLATLLFAPFTVLAKLDGSMKTAWDAAGLASDVVGVDLRVGVFKNPADLGSCGVAQSVMDGLGIPYTVVDVVDGSSLKLEQAGKANYAALVFCSPLKLSDSVEKTLRGYQAKYNVRSVEFGAVPSGENGSKNVPYPANQKPSGLQLTAHGAAVQFSGLRSDAIFTDFNTVQAAVAVPEDEATLKSAGITSRKAMAVYAGTAALNKELAGNDAEAVVEVKRQDGTETMVYFTAFPSAPWCARAACSTGGVFAQYLWIHWAFPDIVPGRRLVLLSMQIDDVFLETGTLDNPPKIDRAQVETDPLFLRKLYPDIGDRTVLKRKATRLDATDVETASKWQEGLKLNPGSVVKLEMAYNGNGPALLSPDPKLRQSAVFVAPASDIGRYDYTFQKPDGFGKEGWPANQEFEWTDADYMKDPLYAAFKEKQDEFLWLSHTFTHTEITSSTKADCLKEISFNQQFAQVMGLEGKPYFSTHALVTPAITGTRNGDCIEAFLELGIDSVVGDSSRKDTLNENPFWSLRTTKEYNGRDGLTILPRFATGILFDVESAENLEWEYNWLFMGETKEYRVVDQILKIESDHVLKQMGLLNHAGYMFHQANLKTINKDTSLVAMWADAVLDAVQSHVTWPIITPTQDALKKEFQDREKRDKCDVNAVLVKDKAGKVLGLAAAAPKSECSVPVMVSREKYSVKGATTEQRGNEPATVWLEMGKGEAVAFGLESKQAGSTPELTKAKADGKIEKPGQNTAGGGEADGSQSAASSVSAAVLLAYLAVLLFL